MDFIVHGKCDFPKNRKNFCEMWGRGLDRKSNPAIFARTLQQRAGSPVDTTFCCGFLTNKIEQGRHDVCAVTLRIFL